jgi:hypothetical protein
MPKAQIIYQMATLHYIENNVGRITSCGKDIYLPVGDIDCFSSELPIDGVIVEIKQFNGQSAKFFVGF